VETVLRFGNATKQRIRSFHRGTETRLNHRVIPAQAGIHVRISPSHGSGGFLPAWIPACAGMTPHKSMVQFEGEMI
jgi:hypothetical protein